MKKIFLLIAGSIFWSSVFCQINVDSLLYVWNDTEQSDTTRLYTMQHLVRYGYSVSQPDSAVYYSKLQYEFAKSVENQAWMATSLNIIGVMYYQMTEFDSSVAYYLKCWEIQKVLGDTVGEARCMYNIAYVYFAWGDLSSALSYFEKSLTIRKATNDKKAIADVLTTMGVVYTKQGNHHKAIEYYDQAYKMYETVGERVKMGYILSNIGNLYIEQEDLARALDQFTMCKKIYEDLDDKKGLGGTYNSMGTVYLEQGEFVEAKKFFLKSLEFKEELADKLGMAICYTNLGKTHTAQKNYSEALDYYNKALVIREKAGDKNGMAISLSSIGNVYFELGQEAEGLRFLERSLPLARETGISITIRDVANSLYLSYKKTGNTTKALEMHELYMAMRDSIMSEENQRETIRTEFAREAEQRDNEISLLNLENEKKQAETAAERNKRMFTLGISGSLILLLLGGGFSVQRSRKQKHQVEITRAELQKNLVENDFLRSQLDPHFIKNALFNIDHLLRKNRTEEAQRYTDSFNRLMNLTLENSRRNLVGLDEELEMMQHYLSLEADRSENRLTWSVNVAEDVNPEEIELPPMILQPLVENALKHGANMKDGKGEVKLEVRVENERIVCIVEDNGGGIDLEKMKQSTSHGLRITRERLEMFSRLNLTDARLEIQNMGNGTRAVVSFSV